MPDDGRIPTVPVVNPKQDPDDLRENNSMDEDDPDGGEVVDIDQALEDTNQAKAGPDGMVTVPVDEPVKQVLDNTGDENQAEEDLDQE